MSRETYVPAHTIRTWFYEAMSKMYRTEVPLYGDLLDIVDSVNRSVLDNDPQLEDDLRRRGEYERLSQERHGAIRVGTASELSMMRRVFAVMGMHPVGYYDLSVAGVPVHSTAFRPLDIDSLNLNPFRVFTSLLRTDLIADGDLRDLASSLLEAREIFTTRAVELTAKFEADGGLQDAEAAAFVNEVLETFRWHSDTVVDWDTYQKLSAVHRLVADVACFKGPHINHLTPRTLDIDAAQDEMVARGIDAKDVIEGPPRRACSILLRQTSFKALEEAVRFLGSDHAIDGTHTARFGEIEQRGAALTPAGRALYEELLEDVRADGGDAEGHAGRLAAGFASFPDDEAVLRRDGLAYFRYRTGPRASEAPTDAAELDIQQLVELGVVEASPIIYEDFLPVSAAGIFQSNLGQSARSSLAGSSAQAEFERDLGASVADPFELYSGIQHESVVAVRAQLHELAHSAEAPARAREEPGPLR